MSNLLRSLALLPAFVLAAAPLLGQSPEPVVSVGDVVGGKTVTAILDIAIEDDGSWSAIADTALPGQRQALVALQGNAGPAGLFLPGAVAGLPGVTARLVNERLNGDYTRSGNVITVLVPAHGYLAGSLVRLTFATGAATDGLYPIASVPDPDTFTVLDPVSGTTSGAVSLQRIFGPPDLHLPIACTSAFLGLMQMSDDGDLLTPPVITPSSDESGLFWNDVLLLRQGFPSTAPELAPGTLYKRLLRTTIDRSQDCLLLARLEDPAAPGLFEAVVKLDLDTSCAPSGASLLSEHVLVRKGTLIGATGNRHLESFVTTEKHTFAVNRRGDMMFLGWLDSPGIDRRVIFNTRSILSEFSRLPGGTVGFENVLALPAACVDLNDLGDYVMQVRHTTPNPSAEGAAIVKGNSARFSDQAKLYQTGDVLRDPSLGGATIRMIGLNLRLVPNDSPGTFPVFVTNSGDVVWFAEWIGGSGSGLGAGIFVNDRLVVQRGQPFGAGYFLDDIGVSADLRRQMEVSPDGRYLLFAGSYTDPSFLPHVGLFRVDLGESVPYGTVAQATGGAGCSHPYPALTLQSQPGVAFPGTGALGDFPLIGHDFQAYVTGAPAATNLVLFAFTPSALAPYPCGVPIPPFGFELLIGAGETYSRFVPYVGGSASHSAGIPLNPALVGSTWYGQAFFFAGGSFLGTSNGMRYVIGAN